MIARGKERVCVDHLKAFNGAVERLGSVPLIGVTEHTEGEGVAIVRSPRSGRLCVRAINEGGNNETMVDVFELLDCLRLGPVESRLNGSFFIDI
jgi:hypothetical protein